MITVAAVFCLDLNQCEFAAAGIGYLGHELDAKAKFSSWLGQLAKSDHSPIDHLLKCVVIKASTAGELNLTNRTASAKGPMLNVFTERFLRRA